MTLHYEITKRINKKKLVAICMLCDKHRIKGEWIKYPRRDNYFEYTHTFCDDCLQYVREYNWKKRRNKE